MQREGTADKLDSDSAHPASLFSISVPRDDRKRTGIESIQPQEPRVGTRQHGSIAWLPVGFPHVASVPVI